MNEPIVAAALIVMLFVLGEVISILTRARVPMLLVAMLGYLIFLWTGVVPKNILDTTSLAAFGSLMIAPLIIHMGTLVPFKVLKGQIKSILIAFSGMIAATLLILAIVTPLFGYATAVSSAGPITGGMIAFIITSSKLEALGLSSLVAIPALLLATQKLVGMPLATFFLKRYVFKMKKTVKNGAINQVAATMETASNEALAQHSFIPKKFQTHTVLLFQLFLGGIIAVYIGKVTGISYSVWALIIGIIGCYFKFYEPKVLEKSNSFGIAMVGLLFVVIGSTNDVTPSLFAQSLLTVVVVFIIGVAGILAGGFVASKLLKWDTNKGIAVALTALFGFPADYILCEEVSRSLAENEEEREWIFNEILPPMLVGGFTTVTTASIVIASILMETL